MAIYVGRDKYEVSSSYGNRDKFVVDLKNHECSCRKFQLTGYPREHAMSCIRKMCLDVKNYTQNDDALPPVFRKLIGRPKLSRNKAGDEPRNNGPLSKLSRVGQQQKCSYHFSLGHNKRTCPRKRRLEASVKKAQQGKKSAGTTSTRNPIKIVAKATTKATTKTQPKRKSNKRDCREETYLIVYASPKSSYRVLCYR
ncbi:hypothetical protein AHAS_Ahas18G0231200 [Arachis hypogaea]